MSTIDRCRCTPYFQDAGGGYTEYVPEWEPSCPEHGEVDHILASGRYTDRRGREWKIKRSPLDGIWWGTPHPDDLTLILHENKMRLLIERDMHRDVCVGAAPCLNHPVPVAWRSDLFGKYVAWFRRDDGITGNENYDTLPEAMDAARALAVGS